MFGFVWFIMSTLAALKVLIYILILYVCHNSTSLFSVHICRQRLPVWVQLSVWSLLWGDRQWSLLLWPQLDWPGEHHPALGVQEHRHHWEGVPGIPLSAGYLPGWPGQGVQWNPSNQGTVGTGENGLIRGFSSFQGSKYTCMWYLGTAIVSVFQSLLIKGFHCIALQWHRKHSGHGRYTFLPKGTSSPDPGGLGTRLVVYMLLYVMHQYRLRLRMHVYPSRF